MSDGPQSSMPADVHEIATVWWVKRDAGPLLPTEAAIFEAWLAENPAHRAAFEEVCALCSEVRTLRPERSGAAKPRTAGRNRLAVLTGLAAAATGVLVLSFDSLSVLWRADFHTGTGETKIVELEDGSHVELAPDSALTVDYRGPQRKLALLEGEAWFEAVPNPARPFVVAAGGGMVTALGTAFDIALEDHSATVTVAKHRVAVTSRGQTEVLSEGQQIHFGANMPATAPVFVDPGDATAWRRGKLIFVNQPLAEVVRILSRYHPGYVFIPSASVRALRVTGVFDARDPLGSLDSMEASLAIHAFFLTDYLVVLYE